MARKASELADAPQIRIGGEPPELPVKAIARDLMNLSGERLELTTRANPMLVKAVSIGYIYTHTFGSSYVTGRVDQVMRLAVSQGGGGRQDLIESLRAGGNPPDAYYQGGGGRRVSETDSLKVVE